MDDQAQLDQKRIDQLEQQKIIIDSKLARLTKARQQIDLELAKLKQAATEQ